MNLQRSKRFSPILGIAAIGLMASGCANQTTSYRMQRLPGGPMIITQDAKTRNLVMVPGTDTDRPNQWHVCAEASPDVFSAMSASASGDFGLNSRGAGTEAQARAAMAIAEAAGSIERTQTINLLRESMYRTCERYMSGAIDRATLVVQAGRDWRAMIAILAIEQLTRTARPPSTVLSAGSTSTSVRTAVDTQAQLLTAQQSEAAALDRLNVAKAAVPSGCGTITDANRATCEGPTRDVTVAQGKYDAAKHNREVWEGLARNPPPPSQADAETGEGPNNSGAGGSPPSDTALQHVAPVIQHIVDEAFRTDETQLFCLQILSRENTTARVDEPVPGGVETVQQLCMQYLAARVQNDIAELRNYQVSRPALDRLDLQTRVVEAYLRRGPGTLAERWNALVQPIAPDFQFGEPIIVPADATMAQIRMKMLQIGEGLQQIVERINQGGS